MISAFRFFDPTKEPVHHWFYSGNARNIIWRAKQLVRGRSKQEMEDILLDAESLLETYFDGERDEAIRAITQKGRHDLIETDEEGRFVSFCQEAYDEFDIKDEETTSELDALEEALEMHFDAKTVGVNNVHRFEYFGCRALSKFEDFLRSRYCKYNWATKKYEEKSYTELTAQDRMEMTGMLLEALDCVSRGERQKVQTDITERYEKKIEQLKERQDSIVQARIQEMADAIKSELASAEAERRKQDSIERNDVRHQKNRDLKARVVGWYASEYRNFPSAAKAAKAFCQRLSEEGIEREQRTIENWLRSYAKQHGIALTP